MIDESDARFVAWSKERPFGAEHADVVVDGDRLRAAGHAVGSDPLPYALGYELETGGRFVTARVRVTARGDGWGRTLELVRSPAGRWSAAASAHGAVDLPAPGGDAGAFDDALDPDLGLSPLFNSMPVLRHGLHAGGGSHDFTMVWISVPDLALHRSRQRYTALGADADGGRRVRFETVGEEEPFVAEVVFDADGLVVDYPGIARRLGR